MSLGTGTTAAVGVVMGLAAPPAVSATEILLLDLTMPSASLDHRPPDRNLFSELNSSLDSRATVQQASPETTNHATRTAEPDFFWNRSRLGLAALCSVFSALIIFSKRLRSTASLEADYRQQERSLIGANFKESPNIPDLHDYPAVMEPLRQLNVLHAGLFSLGCRLANSTLLPPHQAAIKDIYADSFFSLSQSAATAVEANKTDRFYPVLREALRTVMAAGLVILRPGNVLGRFCSGLAGSTSDYDDLISWAAGIPSLKDLPVPQTIDAAAEQRNSSNHRSLNRSTDVRTLLEVLQDVAAHESMPRHRDRQAIIGRLERALENCFPTAAAFTRLFSCPEIVNQIRSAIAVLEPAPPKQANMAAEPNQDAVKLELQAWSSIKNDCLTLHLLCFGEFPELQIAGTKLIVRPEFISLSFG